MEENKEEILANFQSITGIEDLGEAFSHLEETDWDLMTAIQRVMPQGDISSDNGSFGLSDTEPNISDPKFSTNKKLNSFRDRENTFGSVASTSADAGVIDLTSDIDLDFSRTRNKNWLTFNIHFNQQIYSISLPSDATVGNLKERILSITQVPICRQAIRGWPPAKLHDAQKSSSQLCNLDLTAENELILIDLTDEGYMDVESDEINNRSDNTFALNIVQQPEGKCITLNISGKQTILEVKTDVYYITDIPVRHQEWTGWPAGVKNGTTLAQSGIEQFHNFTLQSSANKSAKSNFKFVNSNALATESDSSIDEFEDASDFNACEDFFTDSLPIQPQSRHLIANHTDDESNASMQFVQGYVQRFGQPHPTFFSGILEDALKEACHKPAKDRKLLAIYLHHGESILTNVFCDRLMKHDSVIQTLTQNFILYGWDLTFESNKNLFLSSVSACVGDTASMTVRNIPLDKLPAILIIGKSRLSGRSSCEVLSVIYGNVGLDDLFSRLIEAVEMYSEHIQGEIREEDERAARDQVKAEQDIAYQETLQADMAKEAARKQKEAAIAAENQRIESEQAEKNAKKESIRHEAEMCLPSEPNTSDQDVTKIRIRKPSGEFLERRFYSQNSLKDLLNFITANGFLIDEYKVISSWPRRDLTAIDTNQTLYSLKLYPQETVILEER